MNVNDLASRASIYIRNVEQALDQIGAPADERVVEVVEAAKAYLKDSKHYFKEGDYATAISTASYAEGLLDALRMMGIMDIRWLAPSQLAAPAKSKVFVAGTFDLLHPGHVLYLRQAWELGRVIAVVSRDSTVERIKKRKPIIPEDQRAFMVGSIEYVERARVGYEGDMFKVVEEEKPDIVLLGPNQPFDESQVTRELEKRGINVRVLRAKEEAKCDLCSTTRIVQRILSLNGKD